MVVDNAIYLFGGGVEVSPQVRQCKSYVKVEGMYHFGGIDGTT